MSTYTLTVVTAGLSIPSSTDLLGQQLAHHTQQLAHTQGHDIALEHINLKPLAYPLAEALATGIPPNELDDALDAMERADGIILVSPIYAGSYSGLFKTFMDFVGTDRIRNTPVLLAATGGTARHSLAIDYALRPLAAALRAHPIATGVFAATEDFGTTGSALNQRISRAAAELVVAMTAPTVQLPAATPETVTPAPQRRTPHPLSPVGTPGKNATIPALDSQGKITTLRPQLGDFVPMTNLINRP
ncbi:CE1759 family FMN reductase [Corynebacterium aquilae]|uniref:CE1759 family FMN reductase n=1 Tax=Corynebacterium aquilae TaxID=203263 RepID=UPI00095218B3|nr:CE1759 family FMN reductase [Corynebacterium aquilae]